MPRWVGSTYNAFLDTCGGLYPEYHYHEFMTCLYTTAAGSTHSTKIAEGGDSANSPLYGKWEDFSTSATPPLDACGAHWGLTPDSATVEIYHHHVQDDAPFTYVDSSGTRYVGTDATGRTPTTRW